MDVAHNLTQICKMSTNRGIFETFPNQQANRQDAPFAVVDDAAESKAEEFGWPVKLPERRKVDSPFQVAESFEGFGFEAPARAFAASPFESAPAAAPSSPFGTPAQLAPASPFSAAPQRPALTPAQPIAALTQWQEPAPTPAVQPTEETQSDSFNIRQLELRAIFGVDREMNAEEIMQRSRALPGMRNLARVGPQDITTLDALKNLLPSLGFGSGSLKLYCGSVPLEFIREGSVLLAVQTAGGFAPGVRETLMIVARELNRLG